MTTRQIFLNQLRAGLRGMPAATVEEIVSDYDAHFAEAAAHGRNEQDAASRLGDPARLARELRAEAGMKRWERERNAGAAIGAIVAVLGLATIDLFILLPMLLVTGIVVLALLTAAVCVACGGLVAAVAAFFGFMPGFAGSWLHGVLLSIGIAAGGLSATAFCLLFIIGTVNLLVRYGRLHVRAASPAAGSHVEGYAS